jgi:hypothetical protein
LRGSNLEDISSFQDDAFEDHSHVIVDPGHSHQDTGHTHQYRDCGVYDLFMGFAGQLSSFDNRECPTKTKQTGYAEKPEQKLGRKIWLSMDHSSFLIIQVIFPRTKLK